jgi:hypothetical protein
LVGNGTKMKHSLALWIGTFLLAVMLGLGAQSGQAMTVLQLSATSVAPGGNFDIEVDDPSFDPVALLGVDVDISFDPALLSLVNAIAGSWVSDGGSPIFNPTTGDLSICCWLGGGVGNSIFTAFFDVLSTANPGPNTISTTISFATDSIAVNDPTEYQVNPDPSSVTLMITPSSATPIPEPATGSLLLIGIVGALFVRRSLGLAQNRSWRPA